MTISEEAVAAAVSRLHDYIRTEQHDFDTVAGTDDPSRICVDGMLDLTEMARVALGANRRAENRLSGTLKAADLNRRHLGRMICVTQYSSQITGHAQWRLAPSRPY